MKKVLALFLCLILACGMLISCDGDEIGSYLPNYDYKKEEIEDLTLNLYIITSNETVENAKQTVKQMINQYTETNFHTTLNVYYLTASQYESKVVAAVNSTGNDAANILLVNSPSLVKRLVKAEKLADLTAYLDSSEFGTLNVQIPEALLQGSKLDDKYYTIPNNHVIGEYEYLVIDKEVAVQILKEKPSVVSSYTSLEDAAALIEKMNEAGYDSSKYIYTCNGPYELKKELESQGMICNVVKYPTVTEDIAFSSGFAIVNREEKYNDRAMQIVYAINTDTYLRNLLQYGVSGTNYTLDDNGTEDTSDDKIIRVNKGDNVYHMDLLYTGDLFKAYYCDELGWNATVRKNGALQNGESVVD